MDHKVQHYPSFIILFLDPCLNDTPFTLHFVYISTTSGKVVYIDHGLAFNTLPD